MQVTSTTQSGWSGKREERVPKFHPGFKHGVRSHFQVSCCANVQPSSELFCHRCPQHSRRAGISKLDKVCPHPACIHSVSKPTSDKMFAQQSSWVTWSTVKTWRHLHCWEAGHSCCPDGPTPGWAHQSGQPQGNAQCRELSRRGTHPDTNMIDRTSSKPYIVWVLVEISISSAARKMEVKEPVQVFGKQSLRDIKKTCV